MGAEVTCILCAALWAVPFLGTGGIIGGLGIEVIDIDSAGILRHVYAHESVDGAIGVFGRILRRLCLGADSCCCRKGRVRVGGVALHLFEHRFIFFVGADR